MKNKEKVETILIISICYFVIKLGIQKYSILSIYYFMDIVIDFFCGGVKLNKKTYLLRYVEKNIFNMKCIKICREELKEIKYEY